ncbi:LysE family transporter [Kingella negevensis]|uniref:LysE family translocator n=1 Tax=Kingella negevensis TaxID=1522312 RepID=UPI00254A2C8A|nr:LysE family transporter [Kingella negevensis]MDK4696280.1 LysE family transporter [Kingella negevensis]
MEFWHGFLLITGVHLLGAISPGPDFVFVSQQALSQGKRIGLISSLGVALGLGVHILYSVLGMAALIASAAWLLTAVKIMGGAYLIYLGIKGIRAKGKGEVMEIHAEKAQQQSAMSALRSGFLCNVLNSKAPVYFVSIFTIVLSPNMPTWQLAIYGVWMMVIQFAWFAAVTLLLSMPAVNSRFQKAGHWIDRVLGVAMTALGIKVLVS